MSGRLICVIGGLAFFLIGCGALAAPGQGVASQPPGSTAVADAALTPTMPVNPGPSSATSSRLTFLVIGACFIIVALAGGAGVITQRILTRRR
jgi:hypothetical protein